ncbi:MAG: hypothetical protein LC808_13820 [Actinobacteria bacterium]|nr:hypothetical protein [Actinomycetota bacterium]
MPHVLVGDFGAIVRLGLREIFEDERWDLVAEEIGNGEVVRRLIETMPDVVVLDLDVTGTDSLARLIASDFPAVKVIACSSAKPVMRIFPPFHHGESYTTELDASRLIAAVMSRR